MSLSLSFDALVASACRELRGPQGQCQERVSILKEGPLLLCGFTCAWEHSSWVYTWQAHTCGQKTAEP